MTAGNLTVTAEHLRAAEAILAGRNAARILSAMAPQQPDALLRALLITARRREIELTLMFADLAGGFAFLDDEAERDIRDGRLRLIALAGAINRRWSPLTDYLPCSLWDIDRMLRSGALPLDIVVAQLRDGQNPGFAEFGDMIGYTPSALAMNAAAIFEITSGRGPAGLRCAHTVKLDRADIIIRSDTPAPAPQAITLTAEQREIGRLAASLIPDETTLQLGLGAIAEAVVASLGGKRDLGLHSGILMPSLSALIASGTITGLAKSRDTGIAIATGIYGAGTADDWRNQVKLRPISETHNPKLLLAQDRLWAINSALEVDLTGQVNAEFVDGLRIASGGGQGDFVRAAHVSDGGASVIALPARTQRGRSRIVTRLNSVATSAGQDIDYVVTEHGIANLRGLSARDKAEAIVAIAHPDDRAQLRDPKTPTKPPTRHELKAV